MERRLWKCPECGETYRIPADAADPMLCEVCEEAAETAKQSRLPPPKPERKKAIQSDTKKSQFAKARVLWISGAATLLLVVLALIVVAIPKKVDPAESFAKVTQQRMVTLLDAIDEYNVYESQQQGIRYEIVDPDVNFAELKDGTVATLDFSSQLVALDGSVRPMPLRWMVEYTYRDGVWECYSVRREVYDFDPKTFETRGIEMREMSPIPRNDSVQAKFHAQMVQILRETIVLE